MNSVKPVVSVAVSIFLAMQFTTFVLPETYNKIKYEILLVSISFGVSILYNLVIYYIEKNCKQVKYYDKLKLSVSFGNIFKLKSKKKQLIIVPVDGSYNNCQDGKIADSTTQYYVMKNIIPQINERDIIEKSGYKVFEFSEKKYVLFNVGKLNEDGQLIYKNVVEYFDCIHRLCKIIDKEEKNHLVICPVIGGRLEFKNGNISNQQRLRVMINSFNSFDFKKHTELNIILKKHKEKNRKYNLNKL